jgi:hypothetical protein
MVIVAGEWVGGEGVGVSKLDGPRSQRDSGLQVICEVQSVVLDQAA